MKSEKLQNWALAAEIVAAVAVVISLLFLVHETQENTNAIKAQTYLSLISELNQFRRDAKSEEIAELEVSVRRDGIDTFGEVERFQLVSHFQGLWSIFESAYYAQLRGTLGDDEWGRFFPIICRFNGEPWWRPAGELGGNRISKNITSNFQQYIDANCIQR